MSDPVSALQGARFEGFATIRETGPVGMITLRGKGLKSLDKVVKAITGTKVPAQRCIEVNDDRACGWMSPDEYLLILPYPEVPKALAALAKALNGQHYLTVDVSDARATFRVEGSQAADVLRKLCPVDVDRVGPNELRRTRLAQVPAAFWKQNDGYTLVCFRSVARYVFDLLANSAR
jgi:sarcosine oxidase, subunit gamma